MLGPEVGAGVAIDQLRRDPEPLAGPPDAPPQQVADPELPGDLADVARPIPVGEGGAAGEHAERAKPAQRRHHVLDHAVREIIRLRLAADGAERQHRERRRLHRDLRRHARVQQAVALARHGEDPALAVRHRPHRLAQRGDLHREVALLDDGPGPDPLDEVGLADRPALRLD